jgi:OOP family OmpA-OmpF porin
MRTQLTGLSRTIMNMQTLARRFMGAALLLLSMAAYGEEEVTTRIIEFSPGIGYYNFDADRQLDSKQMESIGLGMYLSRRWAVILNYSRLDSVKTENGITEDFFMRNYHLDGYRFFNTESHLRPYVVAGIGGRDLISKDSDWTEHRDLLDAGIGLYYRITPKWSLRGEARVYSLYSDSQIDNSVSITLGYRLKEGESGD